MFFPAHLPGGTVQSAGKPWQQPGGSSGRGAADQELADLQGPRHQGSVPAEMARHRRQRTQGGQKLCECFAFLSFSSFFSSLGGVGEEPRWGFCGWEVAVVVAGCWFGQGEVLGWDLDKDKRFWWDSSVWSGCDGKALRG